MKDLLNRLIALLKRGEKMQATTLPKTSKQNVTPEWIDTLNENEIFVFGCRNSGRHFDGASNFALKHFGAVMGQREGRQGQSYAIPTIGGTIGLNEIRKSVETFTKYAIEHPELHFLVTPVGCGGGCQSEWDIAPMFNDAAKLPNVSLPTGFWNVLKLQNIRRPSIFYRPKTLYEELVAEGHEAVDLGLSVKWATCNIGAESPEEYGGYYAWGETEEKSNYDWSTYKWCDGSYNSITKYCTDSCYGRVDNKTVLDPEDDVAHVKWGGNWRIPTLDEIKELLEMCTWEWTTLNGVGGHKVTAPNGNSIFLPATGGRYGSNSACGGRGSEGIYQSSTLHKNRSDDAGSLYACSGMWNMRSYGSRIYGYAVRPVTDK